MRTHYFRAALTFAGAVAILQGCNRKDSASELEHQDPGTEKNRKVGMLARCDTNSGAAGATFQLNQLTFTVRHADTITWSSHKQSNAAMEILPKSDSLRWAAFTAKPVRIPPGGSLPIVVPPDADTGRYKYAIRFICNSGAARPDTMLVDPDFILVM